MITIVCTKYHPIPGTPAVTRTDKPHWFVRKCSGHQVQEAWFITKPTKRQIRKFKRTTPIRTLTVIGESL